MEKEQVEEIKNGLKMISRIVFLRYPARAFKVMLSKALKEVNALEEWVDKKVAEDGKKLDFD